MGGGGGGGAPPPDAGGCGNGGVDEELGEVPGEGRAAALLRLMTRRFLQGRDVQWVDYEAVDNDSSLDSCPRLAAWLAGEGGD